MLFIMIMRKWYYYTNGQILQVAPSRRVMVAASHLAYLPLRAGGPGGEGGLKVVFLSSISSAEFIFEGFSQPAPIDANLWNFPK